MDVTTCPVRGVVLNGVGFALLLGTRSARALIGSYSASAVQFAAISHVRDHS